MQIIANRTSGGTNYDETPLRAASDDELLAGLEKWQRFADMGFSLARESAEMFEREIERRTRP